MPQDEQRRELLRLTSTIVGAHVSHNPIAAAELPSVIVTVHQALATLGPEEPAPKPTPAVPIKRSVTPDYIICLEDGTEHKMLKRHLKAAHRMSTYKYLERWGLPLDYPLVSPSYAKQRSAHAKKIGLGRKPGTKKKARRKA